MTRQIIQITGNFASTIFALCDDGTVWQYDPSPKVFGTTWKQLPEIPQDREKEKAA